MERSDAFGEWLRLQRKTVLGLTQAELAHRVACSATMIRKIEKGERRPARELAERLVQELGVGANERAAHVAWARGLTLTEESPNRPGHSRTSEIELSVSIEDAQWVLVPLDAIASIGPEPSSVVQLSEPFKGRLNWVPVPLAALTTFGLEPPCWEGGCNGQDPEISGCAKGSVTVDGSEILDPTTGAVAGTVELRYSRSCQTNWARVARLSRDGRRLQTYLRDEIGNVIDATQAKAESPRVIVYGPMWYAPTGKVRVQACGVIDGCDEVCTSLH